jgi:hypothetical protein
MANFFENADKYIKDWHILTFLGVLVLGYVVYEYSGRQNLLVSNYQALTPSSISNDASKVTSSISGYQQGPTTNTPTNTGPSGLDMLQDNLNGPAELSNVPNSIQAIPTVNNANQPMDPSELLPKDGNSNWATNQSVSPGMNGINLLDSRSLSIGMQSQALRNANHQLRADPVIPSGPAPCFQTTIGKDDTGVGLAVC